MVEELVAFLRRQECFYIEAEAKIDRIQRFINDYNRTSGENININSDGIVLLQEDANKWGLELRLYVTVRPTYPGFVTNRHYLPEYSFRLNDNDVIMQLFEAGFRIGLNGVNHE